MLQLEMQEFDGLWNVLWLPIVITPIELCLICFLLCSQTPQLQQNIRLGLASCVIQLTLVWVFFSKESLCTMFKTLQNFYKSFGESLIRVTQSSEMDLMVTYLDHSDYLVKMRYITSEFLGDARHNDLYQNVLSSAEWMDEKKLHQVLMDGHSVNFMFFRRLQSQQKKKDIQEPLVIGTCGYNTIQGALKSEREASGWDIKKTLKAASIILHHTSYHDAPGRCNDYQSFTGSSKAPLPWYSVKWQACGWRTNMLQINSLS